MLMTGNSQDAAITLEIHNGTDTVGLVEAAAERLAALRYSISLQADPSGVDFDNTQIRVGSEALAAGAWVHDILGKGIVIKDEYSGKAPDYCYHWQGYITGGTGETIAGDMKKTGRWEQNGGGNRNRREVIDYQQYQQRKSGAGNCTGSRGQKGRRHRYPRYEGHMQLYGLFSDLQRQVGAADEGDRRRNPRHDQGKGAGAPANGRRHAATGSCWTT